MRTVFNVKETAPPQAREVGRQDALSAIRKRLLLLSDGEHSVCEIAAEKGIFCHGFNRYSDSQLRQRYAWLVRHDPSISREKLEEIADRWQVARQIVNDLPLACDVQRLEHDTCGGWDDFTNQDLARFYQELLGETVTVVS